MLEPQILNLTDPLDLEIVASSFAALSFEQRLTVRGELGKRSSVTCSTLTHHMKVLSSAGLVVQSRKGRSIICSAVTYDQLRNLSDFLLNACCADASDGATGQHHG
jgi:DNA-binding transcriptional ArsR family regulator